MIIPRRNYPSQRYGGRVRVLNRALAFSFVALLALDATVGVACAAEGQADPGARAQYDQERARCNAMTDAGERANCLQSAGAAYDEAKGGRLDVSQHPYQQNRIDRCSPLPPAEKDDCIRRMEGQGSVTGSVKSGAIIRETDTLQVTPAPKDPGSANGGGVDNR